MMRRRFVIVGASLTGAAAAAALREEGFGGEVVLIGAEPHPPYERSPLSKEYLRGEQPFAEHGVEGSFHAFGDICTHRHCSLADGELEGKTVTCPCHGSQFDVTTGEVLNPPATEPVPVFPLQIEGDEIQVDV